MEDVAQRNRYVTLVHTQQRREVTLPTRVRAVSPCTPCIPPRTPCIHTFARDPSVGWREFLSYRPDDAIGGAQRERLSFVFPTTSGGCAGSSAWERYTPTFTYGLNQFNLFVSGGSLRSLCGVRTAEVTAEIIVRNRETGSFSTSTTTIDCSQAQ